MLSDKTDGMIRNRVGVVIRLGSIFRICEGRDHGIVADERGWIKKTARTMDGTVVSIESTLAWPIVFRPIRARVASHVPFAGCIAAVTRRFEHLCKGLAGLIQVSAIPRYPSILHHVPHTRLMRIEPSKETSACWTAPSGVVKLSEAKSFRSQPIQVGRLDLSSIASKVGKPHVIAQDNNEVGACGLSESVADPT